MKNHYSVCNSHHSNPLCASLIEVIHANHFLTAEEFVLQGPHRVHSNKD